MNTQQKHTPGPWKAASQDAETNEIPIKCGKSILARVAPRPHWDATQESNARLMAAAPALLEALRYAAEAIEMLLKVTPKEKAARNWAKKRGNDARAAIAQAEGGAQ